MRTRAVPPYLLPGDDHVTPDDWTLADGTALGERLDHWDPHTDLEMAREVTIDLGALRAECGLGHGAALALVAGWRSDRTRLRAHGDPVELGVLGELVRAPVTLSIAGDSAGGRLDLWTGLVLRAPDRSSSPLAARRPGSILWQDDVAVALEGSAARFPVTPIDFAAVPWVPEEASWALEWDPEDLGSPVLGALRLLINAGDDELVSAVRTGSEGPIPRLVRSFVYYDIARSLVHGALASERFTASPEEWQEESLGRMLFELLDRCWPGVPAGSLRERLIATPGRFDAELQAALGVRVS